jgi:ABC-2 type transport system ATP-binding protein
VLAVEALNVSKFFKMYESIFDRVKYRKKEVRALNDISLEIKRGEVFGLLGPNGAGKTTFLNIVSTLLLPDAGTVKVFGFDVVEDTGEIRKNINLCSAYSSLYGELTAKENLEIYKMIYGSDADVDHFIDLLELGEFEDKLFEGLSSGNKQKVIIAKALMTNPKLLLLDELTVALDPNIALKVRKIIKNWVKKNNSTVVLATHNMYEADDMCERVAVIHKGRIAACDSTRKLKKMVTDQDSMEIIVNKNVNPSKFLSKLTGVKSITYANGKISIQTDDAEQRLQKIIEALIRKKYKIKSVKMLEPTLEDVFIKITGERLE